MPFFKTQDGCSFYFETYGFESTRPVVVFLNGTLVTTVYWKTHASALEDRFRILLYDARAQGRSDLGAHGLSLGGHVEDLLELLDHLGIEKAHLVGLSHGAQVALACAAYSPQRVDRLVLCSIGSTATARAGLITKSWMEVLRSSGVESMAWVALPVTFGESFLKRKARILPMIVQAVVTRNTKEALMAHLKALSTYPSASALARDVGVPCLVVSASDDPFVTKEGAKELAVLCGAHHEHMVGVGHSIPAEAPELFIRTVRGFLYKA